jgi:hypothetical protein
MNMKDVQLTPQQYSTLIKALHIARESVRDDVYEYLYGEWQEYSERHPEEVEGLEKFKEDLEELYYMLRLPR